MKALNLYFFSFIFLSGCTSIPKVIQGDFSSITPLQSKNKHLLNENIRWSGFVVQTINHKDKTCFEVVETETYRDLRPKRVVPKNGSRFLACKEGFLEPHAFNKRMVTITGKLVAYTEQKIGEYNYEYPVIKTNLIYIWRKTPRYNSINYNRMNFAHSPFTSFSCSYVSLPGYCY